MILGGTRFLPKSTKNMKIHKIPRNAGNLGIHKDVYEQFIEIGLVEILNSSGVPFGDENDSGDPWMIHGYP